MKHCHAGRADSRAAASGDVDIHGCFWHRHPGCRHATVPATNAEFWSKKFRRNVLRDQRNQAALQRLGWRVVVLWECAVRKHPDTVAWQLLRALCDPESGWEDALEAAETETLYESEDPSFCKISPASRSE